MSLMSLKLVRVRSLVGGHVRSLVKELVGRLVGTGKLGPAILGLSFFYDSFFRHIYKKRKDKVLFFLKKKRILQYCLLKKKEKFFRIKIIMLFLILWNFLFLYHFNTTKKFAFTMKKITNLTVK